MHESSLRFQAVRQAPESCGRANGQAPEGRGGASGQAFRARGPALGALLGLGLAVAIGGCARPPETPPRVGAEGQGVAPTAPVASAPVAVAAPANTPPASSSDAPPAPLAEGWQTFGNELKEKLFESTLHDWNRKSQCAAYDYFPDGGIQNFWCHRPLSLTVEKVQSLAGVPIFASGPHPSGSLVLTSAQSFGHYNPAFVRWLVDHASPAPNGSPAQKASREAYGEYLQPLAEVLWRTYRKAKTEEACFLRERSLYAAALARKSLPRDFHERWYYFMNPGFCTQAASHGALERSGDGGVNGNVAKTAVGFWVRRSLDGTMDTFAEGLKKLIEAYQPALLTGP